MPLPDGAPGVKSPWPPEPARPALRLIREWSAWWSADPANLIAVYGSTVGGQAPAMAPKNWFRRFWERIAGSGTGVGSHDRQRAYLHVPLASDMATTSAALLFSEAPAIRIAAAHVDKATPEAKATEVELQRIRSEGGLDARLLEAADYAAGLGGVFLKPTWDVDLADHPFLSVVQPDQALPEFRYGLLRAATLWREVDRTDKEVLRHLERYELVEGRSFVLHALYRGDDDHLGNRMEDAELLVKTGLESSVELPFDGIGVQYVPNLRPNHRLRGSELGEADYGGREGLLDALDEAYASWMRDIRLGKARLMVGRDMLTKSNTFDLDHEVYSPLDVGNATAGTPLKDQITAEQFEIRYEAHRDTTLNLVERVVSGPYSPQTFGLHIEGRAESGTALDIRERRTFMTQQRKAAWWGAAVATATEQLLIVARRVFDKPIEPTRPSVELSDSVAMDIHRMAATVEMLNRAEAASKQTLVEMQHPDWTREQVADEVTRILEERGLALPTPELP